MPTRPKDIRREATALLDRHWGHSGFRGGQWEVIEAALAGKDVLAILPTGAGKSICYQVPALYRDGLTLVISPLIALMQDQVAGLQARGIPATFINSSLSVREVDQRWTDAEFGRYRLLYVAPERLQSELFLLRAERLNITLLAVDEAHCVSEWGPHFRPAYQKIPDIYPLIGEPPVLAVTATATPQVRRDIVEQLRLRSPQVIVKGFDRPNIVWSIFQAENKKARVLDILKGVSGSGIVYAATRRAVEEWATWLQQQGETAAAYHGGMRSEVRSAVQEAWIQGEKRLMVATNAFGMGIDKPDVRLVIHADVPGTLEGYYQEAGRAGRDGAKAYAVLLFSTNDVTLQEVLIEQGHPDVKAVQTVFDAVCNLAQIPLGTTPDEPVAVDYEAVAQLTDYSMGKIKNAVELMVRQEVWQLLPLRRHHGLLRFKQSADAVRRYGGGLQNKALGGFVDALLRTVHADAFSGWWDIDMRLLEKRTALTRQRLFDGLDFLQQRGLLQWRAPGTAVQVVFNVPRSRRLLLDGEGVRRARRRAEMRLRDMLRYARSITCRRRFLLTYFGEKSAERCGTCDRCLGRHEAVAITPADEPMLRHILGQVSEQQPREAWMEKRKHPGHRVDALVDWLLQQGYIEVERLLDDTYTLTEKGRVWYERKAR